MKQRIGSPVIILIIMIILCGGCSKTTVITKPYTPGRILLLPPRDVVSDNVPHPEGVGSGKVFQEYLQEHFKNSAFQLVTTNSSAFSSTVIASKKQGLAEANRMKANYVLQVVLGDFHDAGPATFRPDYVYLDKATMYDVRTGEVVWEFTEPQYLKRPNWGHYHWVLNDHAIVVADSIKGHMK